MSLSFWWTLWRRRLTNCLCSKGLIIKGENAEIMFDGKVPTWSECLSATLKRLKNQLDNPLHLRDALFRFLIPTQRCSAALRENRPTRADQETITTVSEHQDLSRFAYSNLCLRQLTTQPTQLRIQPNKGSSPL